MYNILLYFSWIINGLRGRYTIKIIIYPLMLLYGIGPKIIQELINIYYMFNIKK